jgi:hypothetical protein
LLPSDSISGAAEDDEEVGGEPWLALLLAGFCSGLSVLGAPYMVLALPLSLVALAILSRSKRRAAAPWVVVFLLGLGLSFGAEALREQVVGAHPQSLSVVSVFDSLYRAPPLHDMDAKRLWRAAGNDLAKGNSELRREAEQTRVVHHYGLPFGVLLGLGWLGGAALLRRGIRVRAERARRVALVLVLSGQVAALLIANSFSASVERRVPLSLPLAFLAGPALIAAFGRVWVARNAMWQVGWMSVLVSLLLFLQAFWPRM